MLWLAKVMNTSQIKRTLSKVEKVMKADLQSGEFKEERKSGDYRYTQFTYQSLFSGSLMELHPNIRFELTSFMYPEPYEIRKMGSFIEQYLSEMNMNDVIQEFDLGKFELNVLVIERTVIEELASMIRMSYELEMKELLTKTRHLYDLYITYPLVKGFYDDSEKFIEMVEIVKMAEFDSRFKDMYPIENKWQDAPLFTILDDSKIEVAYREHFGAEFVYGQLPEFEIVKKVIVKLQNALIRCDL